MSLGQISLDTWPKWLDIGNNASAQLWIELRLHQERRIIMYDMHFFSGWIRKRERKQWDVRRAGKLSSITALDGHRIISSEQINKYSPQKNLIQERRVELKTIRNTVEIRKKVAGSIWDVRGGFSKKIPCWNWPTLLIKQHSFRKTNKQQQQQQQMDKYNLLAFIGFHQIVCAWVCECNEKSIAFRCFISDYFSFRII